MGAERRQYFRYPKPPGEDEGILRVGAREIKVCVIDESTVSYGITFPERSSLKRLQRLVLQVKGSEWEEVEVLRVQRDAAATKLVVKRIRELSDEVLPASPWKVLLPFGRSTRGGLVVTAGSLLLLIGGCVLFLVQSPSEWCADMVDWATEVVPDAPKFGSSGNEVARASASLGDILSAISDDMGGFRRRTRISVKQVRRMKLNDFQLRRIESVAKQTRAATQQLELKGGTASEISRARRQLLSDASRQVTAVLSERQRQQWLGLLAKEFGEASSK